MYYLPFSVVIAMKERLFSRGKSVRYDLIRNFLLISSCAKVFPKILPGSARPKWSLACSRTEGGLVPGALVASRKPTGGGERKLGSPDLDLIKNVHASKSPPNYGPGGFLSEATGISSEGELVRIFAASEIGKADMVGTRNLEILFSFQTCLATIGRGRRSTGLTPLSPRTRMTIKGRRDLDQSFSQKKKKKNFAS